jgi:hypothetical protein
LRALFEQGGFRILETRGIPAPFPLALGNSWLARLLLRLNRILIHLSKGLFSYQMIMVVKPYPSPEYLLQSAEKQSAVRGASYLRGGQDGDPMNSRPDTPNNRGIGGHSATGSVIDPCTIRRFPVEERNLRRSPARFLVRVMAKGLGGSWLKRNSHL